MQVDEIVFGHDLDASVGAPTRPELEALIAQGAAGQRLPARHGVTESATHLAARRQIEDAPSHPTGAVASALNAPDWGGGKSTAGGR